MGARRFSPDPGRFLQRDEYEDAFADLDLAFDPLTHNRYSFAGGNPISFLEWDGHDPRFYDYYRTSAVRKRQSAAQRRSHRSSPDSRIYDRSASGASGSTRSSASDRTSGSPRRQAIDRTPSDGARLTESAGVLAQAAAESARSRASRAHRESAKYSRTRVRFSFGPFSSLSRLTFTAPGTSTAQARAGQASRREHRLRARAFRFAAGGSAATVAGGMLSQWQEDAADPNLSTSDKVTRGAVRGGIGAGAASAGGILAGGNCLAGVVTAPAAPGCAFLGGVGGGFAGDYAEAKVASKVESRHLRYFRLIGPVLPSW
jgi:hypothetical protein